MDETEQTTQDPAEANDTPTEPTAGPPRYDVPRPTPPMVSRDHEAVIAYLHEVIGHLRGELLALGVPVQP